MSVLIRGMEMPKCCGYCPLEYKNYCMVKPSLRVESADRHPRCSLIEIHPQRRLIDADEFLKRAIGTKCFRGDYALMLEELVGESTTIVPAEEDE